MIITIFDTETTGLPKREGTLADQPYLIQFAAFTYEFDPRSRHFREIERYNTLIKPPIAIPEESVRITGITDSAVAGAPAFADVAGKIQEIFAKSDLSVAHNISFDEEVIGYELERHGAPKNFISRGRYDTMEGTRNLCKLPGKNGGYKAPRLMELHQFLLNESFQEAHNAEKDVAALARCVKVLLQEGLYQPPTELPVQAQPEHEQISLF
ncbi:3'-5' exonuclease [Candidatus Peregrinibacteria bacterium]|nr:3'-5' exonuclease [Candidatus Peregrinibacteria bacterium]